MEEKIMKSLLGKGIAFALAGTMVLATASCGGSGDSKTQTADSSTGSLEKVEMYTIPDPQMSAAHVIAMEKGYYEEEGLDVNNNWVASAPDLAPMIASGDAKISLATTYTTLSWVESGIPVKIAAPVVNIGGTQCVVARPGLEIKSAKDLEGKKIGMVNGAEVQLAIMNMCDQFGVDKNSLQYVNLTLSDQLTALQKGDIDLMACWEPWISHGVEAGGTLLFSGSKSYLPENYGETVDWCNLYTCLTVTEDVYNNQADVVKKIIKALKKGTDFLNNNLEEAIPILAKQYDLDEDLLKGIMEKNDYTMEVDDTFLNSTDGIADFALQQKVTSKKYELADYMKLVVMKETLPDLYTSSKVLE
jgi:NitT/TauT family transport system substrate-binding protein